MKIIFAGTPEFAVPTLAALIGSAHRVVAVYTQPDRPAGRGRRLQESPVKALALLNKLSVLQPESFKEPEAVQTLQGFEADLMVVVAYGLLLPRSVLEAPRLGCVNIHASLLPRWRGAAPIQRAILAGDEHSGITLMQMDVGLDTGDMLATSSVAIGGRVTAAELHDELKKTGADLLVQNLDAIEAGTLSPTRQDSVTACYAAKLTRQEAEIDWYKPAQQLDREIRAFNPWPASFTTLEGKNIKLWSSTFEDTVSAGSPGVVMSHDREAIQVCCGSGVLHIHELQFAGKKRTTAGQVLNATDLSNERFGH